MSHLLHQYTSDFLSDGQPASHPATIWSDGPPRIRLKSQVNIWSDGPQMRLRVKLTFGQMNSSYKLALHLCEARAKPHSVLTKSDDFSVLKQMDPLCPLMRLRIALTFGHMNPHQDHRPASHLCEARAKPHGVLKKSDDLFTLR